MLTPRLPDMDKFIEQFWEEENLERYKSSEKEEAKEEEEDLSLHIVEEKTEEVNDLRDEKTTTWPILNQKCNRRQKMKRIVRIKRTI